MAQVVAPGTFDLVRQTHTRDLRLVQGSLNEWLLSFDNAYGDDWSGFAVSAQLRADYADDAEEALATISAVIVSYGPGERVVQFQMNLAPGTGGVTLTEPEGRWDAEITNGVVTRRIVMGRWSLNLETTRTE